MILTEVLQGFRYDKDYLIARELVESLTFYRLSGQDIVIKSRDYREKNHCCDYRDFLH